MHEVGGESADGGGPLRLGQDVSPDFGQQRTCLLVRQARRDRRAHHNGQVEDANAGVLQHERS